MSINNRLNMLKPKVNDGSMGYIYSDNDQMINIHGNDDVDDDDQKGHRSILTIFFFSTEKKIQIGYCACVCVCVKQNYICFRFYFCCCCRSGLLHFLKH